MERAEVPLERSQEDILHHAHAAEEKWILGVALTAALLAVLAAVTALLAEHHANEAMLEQIRSSDQWNYYQAKGIKASQLASKVDLLTALGKPIDPKDRDKLKQYREDQQKIMEDAHEDERASDAHLKRHTFLSYGVTLFQVGIAVGAISVLTKLKRFWYVSMLFGLGGAAMLAWGGMIAG
jgi:Flp pilus assembly protein TadB